MIKRREKERISEQIMCCHISTPWGRVGPTGAEGSLSRGAHGLPHGLAKWPHVICTPLARSLGSLPHILSILPPIFNPFSDYEP